MGAELFMRTIKLPVQKVVHLRLSTVAGSGSFLFTAKTGSTWDSFHVANGAQRLFNAEICTCAHFIGAEIHESMVSTNKI